MIVTSILGEVHEVQDSGHVYFLLSLTKRRRHGGSLVQWGILRPITDYPAFAASGKVEEILPLLLVEQITNEGFGTVIQKTWPLEFGVALIHQGGLQLHFTYSLPASKCWPLERCLIGLGWKQIFGEEGKAP